MNRKVLMLVLPWSHLLEVVNILSSGLVHLKYSVLLIKPHVLVFHPLLLLFKLEDGLYLVLREVHHATGQPHVV